MGVGRAPRVVCSFEQSSRAFVAKYIYMIRTEHGKRSNQRQSTPVMAFWGRRRFSNQEQKHVSLPVPVLVLEMMFAVLPRKPSFAHSVFCVLTGL